MSYNIVICIYTFLYEYISVYIGLSPQWGERAGQDPPESHSMGSGAPLARAAWGEGSAGPFFAARGQIAEPEPALALRK